MNRVEGGDINYRPLNMEDITKPAEEEEIEGKKEGENQADIAKPQTQSK